jgi:hypothetical protein
MHRVVEPAILHSSRLAEIPESADRPAPPPPPPVVNMEVRHAG